MVVYIVSNSNTDNTDTIDRKYIISIFENFKDICKKCLQYLNYYDTMFTYLKSKYEISKCLEANAKGDQKL